MSGADLPNAEIAPFFAIRCAPNNPDRDVDT
jgi:hypothetical protein